MRSVDEIPIDRFSKKHVKKLSSSDKIWDVIELMHDFKIRHIPIEDGSVIKGIVNPKCLMNALENYTDPSTFNQELSSVGCQDFLVVSPETSIFEVVRRIALRRDFVALIMEGNFTEGIYTEIDILNTDFIWLNLADKVIDRDTDLGTDINEFNCAPSESTIQQALEIMLHFKINYLGIIDETTKTLSGVIHFMDVLRFLMYNFQKLNESLEYLLKHTISSLFPSAGLYVYEPLLLSTLRRELYVNDVDVAVLLDESSYPVRLISVGDLLTYLVDHSAYFDDS